MQREADWNDWRAFLAVARSGSTLAAARALRVSQTTVARRIAGLEEALGLTLFERRPAGYVPTAAGTGMIAGAEAIEQAALGLEARARAASRVIEGIVRITTEEIFSTALLAPHLLELRERLAQAMASHGLRLDPAVYSQRPVRQRILDHIAHALMRLALLVTGQRY